MQTNDDEAPLPATFNHPKNLHVGLARLIWSDSAQGWAVPGRRYICLEERAREYARRMHLLMIGKAP